MLAGNGVINASDVTAGLPDIDNSLHGLLLCLKGVNVRGEFVHLALERGVVILFRATDHGQSQRESDETF